MRVGMCTCGVVEALDFVLVKSIAPPLDEVAALARALALALDECINEQIGDELVDFIGQRHTLVKHTVGTSGTV